MNISAEQAKELQKNGEAVLYKSVREAYKDKYFSMTICKRINMPVTNGEETNTYALSRSLASYSHGRESYVALFYRDVEIIQLTSCTLHVKSGNKVYKINV